ncbi:Helix-turn-helix [Anaerotruncus sp. 2789STDY5834896]|uniref:Helix-turn-helix n=1 Tax=uncultured Anaerotruncus sp. TaxID=905011 RepID=A0A1C6I996_9FIRM|nr:Helix-turn-helix [uncultured Anaerotruncus sp.]
MVPGLLRSLIEKSGKTQLQIANELGLTQQRFNFYVTGKREPDNEMLKVIADYFGVTTDFLLGHAEAKKIDPSEDGSIDKVLRDHPELLGLREKLLQLSPEQLDKVESYLDFILAQDK